MILFYDTETTGLVNDRLPIEEQPHIVQLAAVLFDEDGTERACFSTIIRPEGYTIPSQVAHIHGITTEIALRCGMNLRRALLPFGGFLNAAKTLVAHNKKFDDAILRAALHREDLNWLDLLNLLGSFCTMEACTPILQLPPTPAMLRAGRNHYKAPRLAEAYEYFFAEKLVGAHDALVDVRACARIYFKLVNEGYAK